MTLSQRDQAIAKAIERDVYLGECTYSELARRYGLSREMMRRIAKKAGIYQDTKWTEVLSDEQRRRAADLYGRGMPLTHIAETIGASRPAVLRTLKALGVHVASEAPPKWKVSEEAFLRDVYGKMSAGRIAEILDRTKNEVIGKANRLGLCRETAAAKALEVA